MSAMTCERASELFSDDLEGTLDPVLGAELALHLAGCEECRTLRRALTDVVDLLRVPATEPASDLATRVARESWARTRPRPALPSRARTWAHAVATGAGWLSEVPFAVQAIAAGFAIALTAGLVLAAGPGAARPRVAQRFSAATVYVLERKDRLVEDLRLLRIVIATAFEGRLDRVNERVDDYRRLLERRPNEPAEPPKDEKKSEAAVPGARWAAAPADAQLSEPRPAAARTTG